MNEDSSKQIQFEYVDCMENNIIRCSASFQLYFLINNKSLIEWKLINLFRLFFFCIEVQFS